MAQNISSFETRLASICQKLLDALGEIEEITVFTWSSANGAGYEQTYNDLAQQDDKPLNGEITKNEANNGIRGLNSIRSAIESASAAISKIAEAKR